MPKPFVGCLKNLAKGNIRMNTNERLEVGNAMIELANTIIQHKLGKEVGTEFENLSNIIIAIMDRSRANGL